MLLAVVYPYSPHELLGLEILADRCSLSSLRQLRHPPRLRGSKLEAVIHALSEQFFDSHIHQWTKQISRIEERSSKVQSGSLFVRLRGLNHAKVVLSAGRLVRTKIYVGEVVNEFSIDC
jgi:hypothetical protein